MKRTIAGTMNWGGWGANLTTHEIAKRIQECVDHEISVFDHADIYGGYTTEASWGKAWSNCDIPRDQVEIISKCGICYPSETGPDYRLKHYNTTRHYIIESAQKSIKNLQCDYLDLLLIHRPSPLMNPQEMAEAFTFLTSEGLVRKIGVSNFTISQMEMLRSVFPISAAQIEINLLHLDPMLDGTLDYCMTHQMEVQAWSPLAGGRLFKKSADYDLVTQRERLRQVADQYNWSLDQMSYLFLLHHPAQIRPVTGSSRVERILVSAKAEKLSITNAQWFEIWVASTGKQVA